MASYFAVGNVVIASKMSPVGARGGNYAGDDALTFEHQSQPNETLKPAHLAKRKQRNKALEVTFNPEEHRCTTLPTTAVHMITCRICTALLLITQPVLDAGNTSLDFTSGNCKDVRMPRGKTILPICV